jgi:HSP20 family molecular chaperone IbpA
MLATLFYHPTSLKNHVPETMSLRCKTSPKRLIYDMGRPNRECRRINSAAYDNMRSSDRLLVKNDGERVEISLDVPGIKINDLSVEVENGVMTVSGQRTIGMGSDSSQSKRRRVFHQFKVSDRVNAENVTANLLNGVLTISFPKQEPSKPQQIKVIEGCDDIQEGNGNINENDIQEGNGNINENDIQNDTQGSSDDDLVIVETVENKEEVNNESEGAIKS